MDKDLSEFILYLKEKPTTSEISEKAVAYCEKENIKLTELEKAKFYESKNFLELYETLIKQIQTTFLKKEFEKLDAISYIDINEKGKIAVRKKQ